MKKVTQSVFDVKRGAIKLKMVQDKIKKRVPTKEELFKGFLSEYCKNYPEFNSIIENEKPN